MPLASIKSYKYEDHSIVLLHENGIVVFDTRSRTFGEVISLSNIRWNASCVSIGDHIHIMNGLGNREGRYLIYSVTDQTVNTFEEPFHFMMGSNVPIIKSSDSHKSANKMLISAFARKQTGSNIPSVIVDLISKFSIFDLFQFGGSNLLKAHRSKGSAPESFYVGSLQNTESANGQIGAEPIQWTVVPEYELKYPLSDFAYIQYGPFIVTFGGGSDEGFRDGIPRNIDAIYILDLRKNCGWIESPIKCPKKTYFDAVMDQNQRIHLISRWGKSAVHREWFRNKAVWEHEHYCINLTDVIPELVN